MPKPIKRSDLNRPLTCAELDENIDRLLDRSNHTGTQACSTIYDLEICIRNMGFIIDLITCCEEVRKDIQNIKSEIYDDNGQLFVLVQRLRTELLNLVNGINSNITDLQNLLAGLDTRVDALEICCSALTASIDSLNARVTNMETKVDQAMPIGAIIMWSGSVTSIPVRWALCNGAAGTPDLRGRFVIGGGGAIDVGLTGGSQSAVVSATTVNTSAVGVDAGGLYADGTSLNILQIPSHKHSDPVNMLYGSTTSGDYPIYSSGSSGKKGGSPGTVMGYVSVADNNFMGTGAPHSHVVRGSSAPHFHDLTIPAQTISVINPFYALAFIMRIS